MPPICAHVPPSLCCTGVIIGRQCKDCSPRDALSYVAGYCVANDVSGRQWQFDNFNGGQWVRSKSFDTFLPLSSEVSVNLGKRLLFNSPVGRPGPKERHPVRRGDAAPRRAGRRTRVLAPPGEDARAPSGLRGRWWSASSVRCHWARVCIVGAALWRARPKSGLASGT